MLNNNFSSAIVVGGTPNKLHIPPHHPCLVYIFKWDLFASNDRFHIRDCSLNTKTHHFWWTEVLKNWMQCIYIFASLQHSTYINFGIAFDKMALEWEDKKYCLKFHTDVSVHFKHKCTHNNLFIMWSFVYVCTIHNAIESLKEND